MGIAAAGAGVLATLVGSYVQLRSDPTPTENILDDVREMQKGCQKDKDVWREMLADEAVELKVCREENSKLKEFEARISDLESYHALHFSSTTEAMGEHGSDNHSGGDM